MPASHTRYGDITAHKSSGDHDSRYALKNHNHDSVYAKTNHSHAWSAITGKPSTFAPSSHNHDDRYFTESETNTKLNAKLDKSLIKKGTITTSSPNWVNLKLQTADRILLSAYVVSGPNTNCECRIYYNSDAKGYIIVVKDLNGNSITSGTYKIEYKYIELYL